MARFAISAIYFLFISVFAEASLLFEDASTYPLPPSLDPFYIPPRDYATRSAGSILRHRKLSSVSANVTIHAAYQLLYRTTSSLGDPAVAITTILIPPHANFSQHLSYQTAYDQADVDCAPSYGLRTGANVTTGVGEIQTTAKMFLERGIPVSTSDYEGEAATFTSGPQAAYGVLDSIRAVMSSTTITGIKSTAQTIMYGYSGGCLATEWASEYMSSYAGELNIIGAAMGGMPVNLTSGFLIGNGSAAAGLVFASSQGLINAYPQFAECLEKHLVPETAAQFHAAANTCNYGALFAFADVWKYFKNGVSFLSTPCWKTIVNEAGAMGLHGIAGKRYPLYMFKGTADEIVPTIQQTDALIQKYCNHDAQIQYVRYINGTHGSTAVAGTPDAVAWLFGILDGKKAEQGCSVTNVTIPAA